VAWTPVSRLNISHYGALMPAGLTGVPRHPVLLPSPASNLHTSILSREANQRCRDQFCSLTITKSSVPTPLAFNSILNSLFVAKPSRSDAIEKAQQLCPDLIILDLSMPEMNAWKAASALALHHADVPFSPHAHYSREWS